MSKPIREIDKWLKDTGLPESRLGLLACANPRAIARIRDGTARVSTLEAVLRYLDRTDHGRIAMIYFAYSRVGNLVKIGYTRNTTARIAGLRHMTGLYPSLIATVPGNRQTEKEMHERFSEYCVSSEWFRFEGRLSKYVMSLPRAKDRLTIWDKRTNAVKGATQFAADVAEGIAVGDYSPMRNEGKACIPDTAYRLLGGRGAPAGRKRKPR